MSFHKNFSFFWEIQSFSFVVFMRCFLFSLVLFLFCFCFVLFCFFVFRCVFCLINFGRIISISSNSPLFLFFHIILLPKPNIPLSLSLHFSNSLETTISFLFQKEGVFKVRTNRVPIFILHLGDNGGGDDEFDDRVCCCCCHYCS